MTTRAKERRPRPATRAARRTENTGRILDAAILCLNKYAYSGTTLALIADAAGVSRGQVQNIFGVKRSDLLVRIAQEIFDRYSAEYHAAIDAASNPIELSDNMWDAIHKLYNQPETLALIELWLATRTDRKLHTKLRDMLTRADAALNDRWLEIFAKGNVGVEKVPVIRFFQRGVMRGLAIERLLGGSDKLFDSIIATARSASTRLITAK